LLLAEMVDAVGELLAPLRGLARQIALGVVEEPLCRAAALLHAHLVNIGISHGIFTNREEIAGPRLSNGE
jgi:hypothetical protein